MLRNLLIHPIAEHTRRWNCKSPTCQHLPNSLISGKRRLAIIEYKSLFECGHLFCLSSALTHMPNHTKSLLLTSSLFACMQLHWHESLMSSLHIYLRPMLSSDFELFLCNTWQTGESQLKPRVSGRLAHLLVLHFHVRQSSPLDAMLSHKMEWMFPSSAKDFLSSEKIYPMQYPEHYSP